MTKRIEHVAQSLLLRAVAGVVRRRARQQTVPDWDARVHRVLYVRHDGIGDLIMSTGVLHALAASHPSLRLDVLTHRANAEALDGLPFINELLPFVPGRRWAYPP